MFDTGLNLQGALHPVMQAMDQNVYSLLGGLVAPRVLQNLRSQALFFGR